MLYLAKIVSDSASAALTFYKNSPDNYKYTSGYIHFTTEDENIVVIPLDLSSDVSGRKINSASLKYYTYWSSDLIIELYSGNSWPYSYNELKSKCTKHAWSGGTTQIVHENRYQSWAQITLTSYASGLEKAFASGDYIFIVLIPDGSEQLIVDSSHPVSLTVNCERLKPRAYNLSPDVGATAYVNRVIGLEWEIDADGASQTSYELGWSADGGNTWNDQTEESTGYYYGSALFLPYTFPEGIINWRVRIITDEGKQSEYAYASFECVKQIPIVNVINPNGIEIPNDKSYRFEWEYSGEDLAQTEYVICWSSDDGVVWNAAKVESANKYHVFAAGEFPVGNIKWKIRASNGTYYSEDSYGEFECIAALPNVLIEFPNELKIPNSAEQIFTWVYSGNELLQDSYEIAWSNDDGLTWNDVAGTGQDEYHIFAADTFPVGNIIWKIRARNTEGYFSEYVYGTFESIGVGEAPVIESITQNAIPTISWSADYQVAYEIQIKKDDQLVFYSGMIGGEEKEYKPNIMLCNGKYLVQIRIMNSYGYISEWGTAMFILEAESPNSVAGLKISENSAHGVVFDFWNIVGNGYIVKIEDGIETIAAKCSDSELCDYYTKCEKTYTYVLRDHVDGYCDTKRVDFKTDFIGVLLHDRKAPENFVNIKWNEAEYVGVNDSMSKNTVYRNCIGRVYPIKETNTQKTETIVVEGFLKHSERDILRKFYENDIIVLMRSRDYCFVADITSYKDSRYMDEGYLIQVSLTRIEDDSEVKLV